MISKQSSYKDPDVARLARETAAGLARVLPSQICYATVVWATPFFLTVPPDSPNEPVRLKAPAVIDCKRARNLTDPTVLVTPGGAAWEWAGGGKARLDAVSGLTPGVKYELTFLIFSAQEGS